VGSLVEEEFVAQLLRGFHHVHVFAMPPSSAPPRARVTPTHGRKQVKTRNVDVALAPPTRAAMSAPAVRINSALSWSLGWGIQSEAGREYLWQWGDNGAWKNHVLVHEPSRSAMVVFTNGTTGTRLVERILREATGHDQAAFLWI